MLIDNIYKKINYKIEGEGNSIVLLHGFMESLEVWKEIYSDLSKKYKILSIDFPGHGKSNSILNYDTIFSMERASKIVKTIIKKEKIQKAFFVGHSMGGYIALALLEKHPEFFLGLCLLHSTAESDSNKKKKIRMQSIKMAINNYSMLVDTSINTLFDPKKLSFLQKEVFFVKKIALSTSVNSVISFLKGMSIRKDRRFLLKKTKFPKLYIIGLYDLVIDPKKIREEVKNGNKTYFIEITTGHMGHIENPKKITKILENFMDDVILKNLCI
ncbi:alpha/beta fold hydrolase [Blattabacterium cuenoti]|uniref:alpha/beta fold hydrolase n=1 Tax=Blattabacterium cuenoti TaxID=1653831 RepID=UPI00163BB00A|nr:alpha/beta fold hydrolase [Blattabacterium cuenoti]